MPQLVRENDHGYDDQKIDQRRNSETRNSRQKFCHCHPLPEKPDCKAPCEPAKPSHWHPAAAHVETNGCLAIDHANARALSRRVVFAFERLARIAP